MRFSKTLIILTFTGLILFSCKEKPVVLKSKTEYLAGTVSKTWRNTKAEATDPSKLTIDLVHTQPDCVKDNILIFYPDQTYEFKEGATKCNGSDPDLLLKSNWSFLDNETKFKIDKIVFLGRELNDTIFDIVELNDNVFTGKTTVTLNGVTYQFVATFQPVQ
ncbi:hypothetical protein [Emticicia agri]|uniref:Lipocalin-like domain-containing protein n=1 Tax=Emticicia agri TaxID=2492393 RepID=A0A4Q5M2A0_9BACT|nr:hypothetical protein [Emticicia agri]RYU96215.1 hypothetical protein EWM59_08370 [Emticicia agri]